MGLTRQEMLDRVNAGQAVSYGGRVLLTAADVPLNPEYSADPREHKPWVAPVGPGISTAAFVSAVSPISNGAQNYTIVGYDATSNVIYAVDTANGFLRISENGGASWSGNKGFPAGVTYVNAFKVVRFGDYVYLYAADGTGATVFRALPTTGGTALSWSARLLSTSSGTTAYPVALAADAVALYLGEYGDPVGGPKIYRSTDGTTWTATYVPGASARHVHGVFPDPYFPGHVYATLGDGISDPVIKSTDYGLTWSSLGFLGGWQAVQLSFSREYVFGAADFGYGSVWAFRRGNPVPKWAARNHHVNIPVPGGLGGRVITDAVFNGTTTMTSATANFNSADVGRIISSPNNISYGATIASVTNSTTVVLSFAAFATASGQTVKIEGERFNKFAYFGAVDPATGIYYCANITSLAGQRNGGLFYLPRPGERIELLDPMFGGTSPQEFFIHNGYVWFGFYKYPLLDVAALDF